MAKKKYFYDKSVYDRRYYLKHKEEILERVRAYREEVKNGSRVPQKETLYETREELQKASEDPYETGEINWAAWDRLIKEYHEKYLTDEYLARPKNAKGRVLKLRYCYNPQGQLVCSGSSKDVSEKLKEFGVHMSPENVVTCSCSERWIHGFYFTSKHYSGHELLILKKNIKIAKQYGSVERYNRLRRNVPSEQ